MANGERASLAYVIQVQSEAFGVPLRRLRTGAGFTQERLAEHSGISACVLQGEHSVSSLARRYPMSFAAVQKHVAILERADLVTKRRDGREQLVSGNIIAVRHARALLDQLETIWHARIDRMGEILAEPNQGELT